MNTTDSSINIALRHIKTGAIFLPIFFYFMFIDAGSFQTYFFMNAKIISLTHILTLGFILMVILGASYMLLPVALGVKIAYEKTFFPVYYAYVFSFLIFAIGMRYFNSLAIALGGSLLFITVAIYNLNMLVSLKKVKKWDYTSMGILFAYMYLFAGIAIGAYMALSFYFNISGSYIFDLLVDHIYAMFIGFVLMLFTAISYRLLPMFYMTKPPPKYLWLTNIIMINAGIIGILFSFIAYGNILFIISSMVLGMGLLLFSFTFFYLMAGRIKKKLDITTFYLYIGVIYLILAVFIGILINFIPARVLTENSGIYYSFGFIGLFGFAGMVIIGFLHKIFPFLISLKQFDKVKKGAYAGLFNNMRAKYLQYLYLFLFAIGVPIGAYSFLALNINLIRITAVVLIFASLLFLFNLLSMEIK
jgi:hypothetical protein